MSCERFDSTETCERYLAGTLPQPERDAFEVHYFECERCFESLRVLQTVREGLRAAGSPMPVAAAAATRLATPLAASESPARKRRGAVWTGIGIAAALFAGAVAVRYNFHAVPPDVKVASPMATPMASRTAPSPPPTVAFELEARMEPPAWDPHPLRGAEPAAAQQLQRAMALYSARDYAAASVALRRVLISDPSSLEARYFLGICELLTGQLELGIAELNAIIASGNASPYLEEARFYLGKALLRQGKPGEARKQFEIVAAQPGDLRDNALSILNRLPLP
jgi:hypothetical protein